LLCPTAGLGPPRSRRYSLCNAAHSDLSANRRCCRSGPSDEAGHRSQRHSIVGPILQLCGSYVFTARLSPPVCGIPHLALACPKSSVGLRRIDRGLPTWRPNRPGDGRSFNRDLFAHGRGIRPLRATQDVDGGPGLAGVLLTSLDTLVVTTSLPFSGLICTRSLSGLDGRSMLHLAFACFFADRCRHRRPFCSAGMFTIGLCFSPVADLACRRPVAGWDIPCRGGVTPAGQPARHLSFPLT